MRRCPVALALRRMRPNALWISVDREHVYIGDAEFSEDPVPASADGKDVRAEFRQGNAGGTRDVQDGGAVMAETTVKDGFSDSGLKEEA